MNMNVYVQTVASIAGPSRFDDHPEASRPLHSAAFIAPALRLHRARYFVIAEALRSQLRRLPVNGLFDPLLL